MDIKPSSISLVTYFEKCSCDRAVVTALLNTHCSHLQGALGFELGCSRHVPVMLLGRQNSYQGGCYSISLRSLLHRGREGSFPSWQPSRNKREPLLLPCLLPSEASALLLAGSSAAVPTHPPVLTTLPEGLPEHCLAPSGPPGWAHPQICKCWGLKMLLSQLARTCEPSAQNLQIILSQN